MPLRRALGIPPPRALDEATADQPPVAGTVSATNEQLDSSPEIVNADPFGDGWLVELRPTGGVEQALQAEGLMDAEAYAALTASA